MNPSRLLSRLLSVLLLFTCLFGHANESDTQSDFDMPTPFTLKRTGGGMVTLTDLRGKVILINFWASWCGPCITEIPSLRTLYREMKGRPFEILAINVKESEFKVYKFTQLVEMPFPILLDEDGKIFDSWNSQVLPTSYLLGPEGKIQHRLLGPVDWASAEAAELIESLLPRTNAQ